MRVYISGPMTGYVDYNLPEFHRVANLLRDKGYEVISPAEIQLPQYPQGFKPKNGQEDTEMWRAFMRADIKQLMDADAIVVLQGWRQSKGANIEVKLGIELGMLLYDVDELLAQENAV